MDKIEVKVVNNSHHDLPGYSTLFSAGMDLRAFIESDIILQPLERVLIPTGLYIELPVGYEAQIRPRSGLAIKHGISVLNTPGTIDSDYRGEVKILLIKNICYKRRRENMSDDNFKTRAYFVETS